VPGLYHTNLGLVQASTGSYSVEVAVFNSSGTMLGAKTYSRNTAWHQINDLFDNMGLGGASVEGGWIRVRLVSGSPSYWTCYASVVDDLTNDPTFIGPVDPSLVK
jgi:hypothetical protein